jgi:hypothetical protein
MKEVDPELLFLVIFHYGLDHGLLKLQKRFIFLFFFNHLRNGRFIIFQNFWMNVWRSLIPHIYSVSNITITFTLAYSFHELVNEAIIVGIDAILPCCMLSVELWEPSCKSSSLPVDRKYQKRQLRDKYIILFIWCKI